MKTLVLQSHLTIGIHWVNWAQLHLNQSVSEIKSYTSAGIILIAPMSFMIKNPVLAHIIA